MTVEVYEGDCREVVIEFRQSRLLVDSVVTDPPYVLESITKRFGNKDCAPAQFGRDGFFARSSAAWIGQKWDASEVAFDPMTWLGIRRIMKPGAFLFAFGSPLTGHRMATAIEQAGFRMYPFIGWAFSSGAPKPHPTGGGAFHGTGSLRPALEPIYVAQNPISERTYRDNMRRWGVGSWRITHLQAALESRRWPTNLILSGDPEIDELFPLPETFAALIHHRKATAAERAESSHPTIKPVSLLEVLICAATPFGGTVLDPFAGSGATGVAAINLSQSAILIEQHPGYVAELRGRFRAPWEPRYRPLQEPRHRDII
jgi:site-specific DNA-methyltransferase (adenine-specific)